jgi:aspartyl-tRNA(Asn)/glutamyl-tRNA(Gln) amidotransferase subunit C
MPEPLSLDQVRHVAKLARLRLNDVQLAQYRTQLSSVLDYIAKISELDVTDVEPMAQPTEITNRLDDDQVSPPMDVERLLALAPKVEDRFIAVPKVLDDSGGGGGSG